MTKQFREDDMEVNVEQTNQKMIHTEVSMIQ